MESQGKTMLMATLSFVLMLFLAFGEGMAQEGIEATLSGKVVDDSTEQSLSGVEVNIEGMNKATTTDQEGNYRFENLQAGNYTVSVEAEGYETWEKEVEINEERVRLDIRLKPDLPEEGRQKQIQVTLVD